MRQAKLNGPPGSPRWRLALALVSIVGIAVGATRAGADTALSFSYAWLVDQARARAQSADEPPPSAPPELLALPYDDYRQIRFRPDRAVPIPGSRWSLQFFHPGNLFPHPVRVNLVEHGLSHELPFDRTDFSYDGPLREDAPVLEQIHGWAGFRLHRPRPVDSVDEEFVVFLGGSYFRARASGGPYGLSARGLALDSGLDVPEEFPRFSEYWVGALPDGRPVVHALLESPRAVGAYQFEIGTNGPTMIDVKATLFFRELPQLVGLAPLTSMYAVGVYGRLAGTDFRPQVHDNDGLSISAGDARWLWRPLNNPEHRRWSVFALENPHGFGLVQRERAFGLYADLEAAYHLRPNLWIEPRGGWGKGSVRLLELPTPNEYSDNIVAFWTPAQLPQPNEAFTIAYRMTWAQEEPWTEGSGEARVERTLVGTGVADAEGVRVRRIFIDFSRPRMGGFDGPVEPQVSCSNAVCSEAVVVANDEDRGWRVFFDAEPTSDRDVELSASLHVGSTLISEVWHGRLDGL